jgi:hypothetical protein
MSKAAHEEVIYNAMREKIKTKNESVQLEEAIK